MEPCECRYTDGRKEQLAYIDLGEQGAQDSQTPTSLIENKSQGQKVKAISVT
jgi:hypothetical protein